MIKVYVAIGYVIAIAVFCKIMEHCSRKVPQPTEGFGAGPIVVSCSRIAPHLCKVNGPCNGYPKETK